MRMKKRNSCLVLSGIAAMLIWIGCSFQSERVDLIVHNGVVLTLDGANTVAQAVAVDSGRIVAVGPERAILNKYAAEQSLDLRGGVLTPGLMDGHAHLIGYADGLLEANLFSTSSWEDAVERVIQHQAEWPSEWAVGRGWDQNDWDSQAFPDRKLLDAAFPDQPVALERIDGHAMVVNAEALRRAGLLEGGGPVVEGGEVVLDGKGLPTGVLIDNACGLVSAIIPSHPEPRRLEALLEAQSNLLAHGIVSITDAGLSPAEIERIDALQEAGLLKLRVNALVTASDENIAWLVDSGRRIEDMLVVNGVKFYMDGALGSRGALLRQPYSDRKGWFGLATQRQAEFKRQIETLYGHGLQAATHCIGDSATALVLDAYAEVLEGPNDRRWRIEHAQVVSKEDVERFGGYSVIPSVQPTHATSDMYWAGERLGRSRIRRAYAYQELLQALGMTALGTDFPVEDIDTRKTFAAAVARKDANGFPVDGFQPENALTPEQALRGMTQWVALAQFQENDLGTIEVGKWADLTWMDRNWLLVDAQSVLATRIFGTCIAGEWCFLESERQ
ncbi:MAG TPA: amidohydrolase [Flavobacteriales bacterium]|nr:amidohydrolase [Flavobacteriales bacterium]